MSRLGRKKLVHILSMIIAPAILLLATVFYFPPAPVIATGLPITTVYGTLASNQTWTAGNVYYVSSTLVIPDNVTLTIEAGSIVKFYSSSWSDGIKVNPGGALDADGTTNDPIIFTSYMDDLAGGDSNMDGASVAGIHDYPQAIYASGGEVSIAHTIISSASAAIATTTGGCNGSGYLALANNTFKSSLVLSGCAAANVTLERNNFSVPAGDYPLSVSSGEANLIQLDGVSKNTFTGTGTSTAIKISANMNIPSGANWTIDSSSGLQTLYVTSKLTVNGSLSLDPGVTVKSDNLGYDAALVVAYDGILAATGSSTDNVVFTSSKDDSAGGDTNGDGSSAVGPNDYLNAISTYGGSINLQYTVIKGASDAAVDLLCHPNSSSASVFTDNTFYSPAIIRNCPSSKYSMLRNHFAVTGVQYPIFISSSEVSAIQLTGIDKNIFTGLGQNTSLYLGYNDSIPSGTSWDYGNDGGLSTLYVGSNFIVAGTFNASEGSIIKLADIGSAENMKLNSNGTLNLNGSSAHPVLVTSYKDDGAGGDTTGEGSSIVGASDYYSFLTTDYGTVSMSHVDIRGGQYGITGSHLSLDLTDVTIAMQHGAIDGYSSDITANNLAVVDTEYPIALNQSNANFDNTTIANAAIGLSVQQSSQVNYRGTFVNISDKAIKSCNWIGSCHVDATYVDWGSANGPYSGSGNLICGSVAPAPWLYNDTPTNTGTLFDIKNCDNAGTPEQVLTTSVYTFQARMGLKNINCGNGYQDACDAMETAMACLQGAWDVASGQVDYDIPPVTSAQDIDNFTGIMVFNASAEVASAASPHPTGLTFGLISEVIGIVQTFHDLSIAYDNCAP